MLRTTATSSAKIRGEAQTISHLTTPECRWKGSRRFGHERACRHFLAKFANWTPEENFQLRLSLGQDKGQRRLALAALVVSVISLLVSVLLKWDQALQFLKSVTGTL